MRRALIVSCALAVVLGALGACGGDESANPIRSIEPQRTASSPSPDPETIKDSEGCRLLTGGERRSIAGEKLEIVAPLPVIDGALLCRWVKTLKTPVTTSLKVVSQPLQVWVKSLPKQIERLMVSGRSKEEYSERLQTAKKEILGRSDEISNKEACKYFSLLVEISMDKKNKTEGILFQGTQRGDYKVTWQRCAGGVHTELVYEEPGLQVSLALSQAVIRLGKTAHKRAVDKLQ
ncbi:MAG: hypothetical protein ACRDOT_04970 [Aeromicrobium sp.]